MATNHVEKGKFFFLLGYVTLFNMDEQHLLVTAARERSCFVSCREVALPVVGSDGYRITDGAYTTIIIIPIMLQAWGLV